MILGISGIFGHDSAAAALSISGAAKLYEEERLARVKRAQGLLPVNALGQALQFLGRTGDNFTKVAFSWSAGNFGHPEFLRRLTNQFDLLSAEFTFFDHHLCHAAYAISHSGLSQGGFIINDGHAENKAITIGYFEGDRLQIIREIGIRASLGHFYEAVSNHLGFGYEGTGKLMGLASYAEADVDHFGFGEELKRRLTIGQTRIGNDYRSECRKLIAEWSEVLERIAPAVKRAKYDENIIKGVDDIYLKIAASAQNAVESVLTQLIDELVQATSCQDIVLGGGVALNCSANAKVEDDSNVNIFVAPASGDSGAALGAAYLCNEAIPRNKVSPYLGGEWGDAEIVETLRKAKVSFREVNDPGETILSQILDGNFVARFVGASEVGPRALGNRSILARADSIDIRDQLNDLKGRERWRPFAPAVRYSARNVDEKKTFYSPYMLKAIKCPTASQGLRGAIHVDGTARIQTVSSSINSGFFDLLDSAAKAGLEGLINTSFNDNLEPIVYSPRDAIRTFFSTGLSCMQLGESIVVTK